jgi:hypothetical protein
MPDSPTYPGAPRWVKVVGAISLALVAVFVVVHLAGGGFHDTHGSEPAGAGPDRKADE